MNRQSNTSDSKKQSRATGREQQDASRTPLDTRSVDTSSPKLPVLMTVAQTAVALGICEASVRTLIENGEIPVRRMGGRWKVPSAELIDLWHQAEAERRAKIKAPSGSAG